MEDLIDLGMEFFTDESYQEYQKRQNSRRNDRLRGDNETIFDALLSDEADFRNTPHGAEIISAIREYEKNSSKGSNYAICYS